MNKARLLIKFFSEKEEIRDYDIVNNTLTVSRDDIPEGVSYVEIFFPEFEKKVGDDGYYVIPNVSGWIDNEHAVQVKFREREDMEYRFIGQNMPIFAVCDGKNSILAVCDGMGLDYSLRCGVNDGKYTLHPRYPLWAEKPYEDISIHFFDVEGDDWCAIARRYRQYQLDRGACKTLSERVKSNDVLKYQMDAVQIRVRHAWKVGRFPKDQTLENEPPLHVAVTFPRLEKLMRRMKAHGMEKADLCLVGWNVKGHDGRFPDLLPVEPELGGEEELRKMIKSADELGYYVSAHTNHIISGTISERLDRKDWQMDRNGKNFIWADDPKKEFAPCACGACHTICDKRAAEKYVPEDMELCKDLGFKGSHYFDQTTIFHPTNCFDPAHPMTKRECANYRAQIMQMGRDTMGTSASEGGYDFCIGNYDYALYPVMNYKYKGMPAIADNSIPFWYVVYHGIVLYNAYAKTVNSMFKSPDYDLISIEHGAKPLAYLHGRVFEYEGEPNFTCATDEELEEGAKIMGDAYKRYMKLSDLQYEFLDEHRYLTEKVVFTKYSSGDVIIVNYSEEEYDYNGQIVAPLSYIRTK